MALPPGILSAWGPIVAFGILMLIAFAAGIIGVMLGIGGGLILVPALFLLFSVDIRVAIASSLLTVVATSIAAAGANVESGLTNLRLGMFLETATVVGGLVGALVSIVVLTGHEDVLVYLFVPVIVYSAFIMFRQRHFDVVPNPAPDALARHLKLDGEYPDPQGGGSQPYRVTGTRIGLFFGFLAGVASGLLGIGGGVFKVPAMSGFMNVPIRVASATSNFMIGVTAASGALVYLFAGEVSFALTAAVVIGVLVGGLVGVRLAPHASILGLRSAFVVVLAAAAVSMLLQATGIL